jgi:hypothetical protein
MKLNLILSLLAAGALLSGCSKPAQPAAGEAGPKPEAAEEEKAPKVSRDAKGNTVISMDDELQGDMGIQVTNPARLSLSPELKAFGQVLDPAPLNALLTELAAARAAGSASSNELARLRTMEAQGNSSARALQAAEAAAVRDQLAAQSAQDRLKLGWGRAIAESGDLPALARALANLDAALFRMDLTPGDTLKEPGSALVQSLSGDSSEAQFLGLAPSVDPQFQARGFLFLVQPNPARFAPGQAVTGRLKAPGEPLAGVVIPRDAIVRTEGAGWVYVLDKASSEAFTRTQVALDHPLESGWFVTEGVRAGDYLVIKGAQQLLSIESKGGSEE